MSKEVDRLNRETRRRLLEHFAIALPEEVDPPPEFIESVTSTVDGLRAAEEKRYTWAWNAALVVGSAFVFFISVNMGPFPRPRDVPVWNFVASILLALFIALRHHRASRRL